MTCRTFFFNRFVQFLNTEPQAWRFTITTKRLCFVYTLPWPEPEQCLHFLLKSWFCSTPLQVITWIFYWNFPQLILTKKASQMKVTEYCIRPWRGANLDQRTSAAAPQRKPLNYASKPKPSRKSPPPPNPTESWFAPAWPTLIVLCYRFYHQS